MADLQTLDRAFHCIMQRFIETGQAPHYTEMAAELGIPMEEGRLLLHQLIPQHHPAWVHSETDYIVSFAPFHNLPTQYRITIDGQQKWFAQ